MNDKYLNTKKAAEFCGYNHRYFAVLMEKYKIPRYGPKRNRFRVSDIEEWMKRPELFNIVESQTSADNSKNLNFRRVR
jgi:predicted DNA-binding transcriptional regulator AlpA